MADFLIALGCALMFASPVLGIAAAQSDYYQKDNATEYFLAFLGTGVLSIFCLVLGNTWN